MNDLLEGPITQSVKNLAIELEDAIQTQDVVLMVGIAKSINYLAYPIDDETNEAIKAINEKLQLLTGGLKTDFENYDGDCLDSKSISNPLAL